MGAARFFEAAYAPAEAVRRAACRWEPGRLSSYARWSLEAEGLPEPSAAEAAAMRILTRGRLTLASPSLEGRLAAFRGRAALALKVSHRLQVASLSFGVPAALDTDLAELGFFTRPEAETLVGWASEDLRDLLRPLRRLFPVSAKAGEGLPLFVSFCGACRSGWENAWVSEGWPEGAAPSDWAKAEPVQRGVLEDSELRYFSRLFFRHDSLRPGQAEALRELLSGKDVGVLMPTGSGKSLVFQMAALLLPGTALVAEPLLSLIRDQLRQLKLDSLVRTLPHGVLATKEKAA